MKFLKKITIRFINVEPDLFWKGKKMDIYIYIYICQKRKKLKLKKLYIYACQKRKKFLVAWKIKVKKKIVKIKM